jgi:hypothetical protein
MKLADIFKLIVRVFGVFFLYQAVNLISASLALIGSSEPMNKPVFFEIIGLIAVAAWFLFGAPPIQHFAYPETRAKSTAEGKAAEKVESKVVEEVENGSPCVRCNKRISADSKICPFCGWTQPG